VWVLREFFFFNEKKSGSSTPGEQRKRVVFDPCLTRYDLVIYAAEIDDSKGVLIAIERQKGEHINFENY
jgi:hypothetical protein